LPVAVAVHCCTALWSCLGEAVQAAFTRMGMIAVIAAGEGGVDRFDRYNDIVYSTVARTMGDVEVAEVASASDRAANAGRTA